MPISAGDFRKGVVFEMDGKPMLVVDFQHVKPGKGAAFVRTKYKNVMTGAIRQPQRQVRERHCGAQKRRVQLQ